ncbi:N-acetylglucosaminyl-phosphatidylinositol de-N-acetylase [Neosynchiropus ocellatus]
MRRILEPTHVAQFAHPWSRAWRRYQASTSGDVEAAVGGQQPNRGTTTSFFVQLGTGGALPEPYKMSSSRPQMCACLLKQSETNSMRVQVHTEQETDVTESGDVVENVLLLATSSTTTGVAVGTPSIGDSEVRALIITAHPDDECMFFAPTIIQLGQCHVSVHLLCLSEGNFYDQGSQRRQELYNGCTVLGIPTTNVTVLHNKSLPDDPGAEWNVSLVSSVIVQYIRKHSINMVLTFDEKGVSGHANHTAIYKAVRHLSSRGPVPNDCCLLALTSVGLIRKYISLLELPVSWLLPSSLCCVIGSMGYGQARAAMLCHRTQLLWFRYVYITFSRYMFINTFHRIPQGPKDLKIN